MFKSQREINDAILDLKAKCIILNCKAFRSCIPNMLFTTALEVVCSVLVVLQLGCSKQLFHGFELILSKRGEMIATPCKS
jgi:hypothetical protein